MLLSVHLLHVPPVQWTHLARFPLKVRSFVSEMIKIESIKESTNNKQTPSHSPFECLWREEDQMVRPDLQPVPLPRGHRWFATLLQNSLPANASLVLQHRRILTALPERHLILTHCSQDHFCVMTGGVTLWPRLLLQHRVIQEVPRLVTGRRVIGQVPVRGHQATGIGTAVARGDSSGGTVSVVTCQ